MSYVDAGRTWPNDSLNRPLGLAGGAERTSSAIVADSDVLTVVWQSISQLHRPLTLARTQNDRRRGSGAVR